MDRNSIEVLVLGDYGPFSRTGKSIGYLVKVCGRKFLIDCGAPLFDMIGGHGLGEIDGLIVTHCHDDHKRWFSDLALFCRYAQDLSRKVSLIAIEDVYEEIIASSIGALDRSLSTDSKRIIDIPFKEYVDYTPVGPAARYKIGREEGGVLAVIDRSGQKLPPERAKVVVNPDTGRPRMLYRDTATGQWIEPESYYGFTSREFFEEEDSVYRGEGFVIKAVKGPVWHGIPAAGVRIETADETLFFTTDTVHDIEIWRALRDERHSQRLTCPKADFEKASFLSADINDLVERIWSQGRYDEAVAAFDGSPVIQDISSRGSIVHTDYERLGYTLLERERTLLTHSPDRMTSFWPLCYSGKRYIVRGGRFHESRGERLFPINADVYHKEKGKFFVGFKNPHGKYTVYENKSRTLRLPFMGSYAGPDIGEPVMRVDLYEDVGGEYFSAIEESDRSYLLRKDGRVELFIVSEDGSSGTIVKGCRESLTLRAAGR